MTFQIGKAKNVSELGKTLAALNLGAATDSTESVFLDRVKQMGGWRYSGGALPADCLDGNGNLIDLPGGVTEVHLRAFISATSVSTALDAAAMFAGLAGQYVLTWEGGPASVSSIPGATINSSGTRTCTFTIGTTPANIGIYFSGINTSTLPQNPKVIRTDHQAAYDAGGIFTPEWLATIDPAEIACLRFMDWMTTNNSTAELWVNRKTIDHLDWSSYCPVEVMVALCNLKGIPPWFCMPHLADEDYWTGFATYVKANLDPSLIMRAEYGNEWWNFGFAHTGALRTIAQAYFGVINDAENLFWGARQTARMAKAFDDVFGSQKNYKIVLSAQSTTSGSFSLLALCTPWDDVDPTNYIAPHLTVDEIAIAPYFGNNVAGDAGIWTTFDGSGEAAALAYIDALVGPAVASSVSGKIEPYITQSQIYGVPLISYENGPHIELNSSRNRNLYKTIFTVPDATAYTMGETVTQTGTGAFATVVGNTGATLELDTEATADSAAFNSSGDLTGGTSSEVQTPSALDKDKPKDGVLELFETYMYSTELGGHYADHIAAWAAAGGTLYNIYNGVRPHDKNGSWGIRRWLSDDNDRLAAIEAAIAANPRSFITPPYRRAVTWPS